MPDGDESGRLWPDAATGRTTRGVLLAALVVTAGVVAGCGALGDDGTPTPTPTPDAEDRLRANLSASPTTVFQRVEDLVGAELQAYPGVRVGTVESENVSRPFFLQVVGPPEDRSTLEQRPVARFDGQTITVDRERVAAGEGAVIEAELAYYAMGLLGRDHGWTGGTDRPHGGAILRQSYRYVVDAYAEQHRPEAADRPAPYGESDASDYEWAREDAVEYYAYQWVSGQVDSPADVPGLLTGESPPSDEHFLADDADEPMALGISLNTSSRYRAAQQRATTQGAVTTQAVLRTGLDEATARQAAEGWGQDRYAVVRSTDGNATGVAWVHRWDSAADADEFEDAMSTYLKGRRGETDDLRFEVRRLDTDTTVVVTGPPSFVDATNITYESGNVTVGVGTGP